MPHEIEIGEVVYAKFPGGYMATTVRAVMLSVPEPNYILDAVPGAVTRSQFLDEMEFAALN